MSNQVFTVIINDKHHRYAYQEKDKAESVACKFNRNLNYYRAEVIEIPRHKFRGRTVKPLENDEPIS